jgi:hypothetical protein
MHVVEGTQEVAAHQFDNMKSAPRIRYFLGKVGVPGTSSSGAPELSAFMSRQNCSDIPDLVTKVRNALVHPTPQRRAFLDDADDFVRFQALQAALCCLELGLLAIFGYQGTYVNRLIMSGSVSAATSLVPWAQGHRMPNP